MATGRKWPKDPNYWLLVGICLYGLLALLTLSLTLFQVIALDSWVHVGLLLVLPAAGFLTVFGLHFGSLSIRFHPALLIGFLAILALALLIYLHFHGLL